MNDSKPTYVILGAYGGIGSALCKKLSASGGQLVVAGRNSDALQKLANETNAMPVVTDATDPDQVKACIETAKEEYGEIHGVANCVGSVLLKPAHLTSDDEWNDTIQKNLFSAFNTVRFAAKAMTQKGGSIVLVSTAAARTGIANHEAIAAAKAGVIGLAQSAAATYATRNIRINCVAPGLVETPMTERITSNEASLKASIAMHALGRIGQPNDIASAIAWLLDPENAWITGQVLGVDGGLGTLRGRS